MSAPCLVCSGQTTAQISKALFDCNNQILSPLSQAVVRLFLTYAYNDDTSKIECRSDAWWKLMAILLVGIAVITFLIALNYALKLSIKIVKCLCKRNSIQKRGK